MKAMEAKEIADKVKQKDDARKIENSNAILTDIHVAIGKVCACGKYKITHDLRNNLVGFDIQYITDSLEKDGYKVVSFVSRTPGGNVGLNIEW